MCELVTEKEKEKGERNYGRKYYKQNKTKKSEIKQKIQNNVNVHRLVTGKKQKKC